MPLFREHQIEVFEGERGGFFWRARHMRTYMIIADGSESYSTRSNARRAARRIGRALAVAPVIDLKERLGGERVR